MRVEIDPGLLSALTAEAPLDTAPSERCGLLLGRRTDDGLHITGVLFTANVAPRPEGAFRIRAGDILEAFAETRPREPVGVFHTHPRGPAEPSATDLAFAALWPGWVWAVAVPGEDLGLFVVDPAGAGWREVRVVSSAPP